MFFSERLIFLYLPFLESLVLFLVFFDEGHTVTQYFNQPGNLLPVD